MWWLALPALAENMATESLDWMAADAEVIVRASVVGAVPETIPGDAWGQEAVTVRVLEVVSGPAQPETLTWTWRTRPETLLGKRVDTQVLLFLTRGEDGLLAPRSWMLGYVDLAHPTAWTASTSACEVLDTGQDVLAYVRDMAPNARSASPASHWSTWTWHREETVRKDCSPETETFRALWAGSAVEVIVPK